MNGFAGGTAGAMKANGVAVGTGTTAVSSVLLLAGRRLPCRRRPRIGVGPGGMPLGPRQAMIVGLGNAHRDDVLERRVHRHLERDGVGARDDEEETGGDV